MATVTTTSTTALQSHSFLITEGSRRRTSTSPSTRGLAASSSAFTLFPPPNDPCARVILPWPSLTQRQPPRQPHT
ncbi:hypothetical protein ACFPRL_11325 [Pseudoclavibacter helvolus]